METEVRYDKSQVIQEIDSQTRYVPVYKYTYPKFLSDLHKKKNFNSKTMTNENSYKRIYF